MNGLCSVPCICLRSWTCYLVTQLMLFMLSAVAFLLGLPSSQQCSVSIQYRVEPMPRTEVGTTKQVSNRSIRQAAVQPTIPQGLVLLRHMLLALRRGGHLSKCIQCEGSYQLSVFTLSQQRKTTQLLNRNCIFGAKVSFGSFAIPAIADWLFQNTCVTHRYVQRLQTTVLEDSWICGLDDW